MFDLLIRNALVFDGSGAPPVVQDLAVRGGRIEAIGARLDGPAAQVVDAQGLALMPGIIDSHTHFDAQITWDPYVQKNRLPLPSTRGRAGFAPSPFGRGWG